jgi:hypothetical protein
MFRPAMTSETGRLLGRDVGNAHTVYFERAMPGEREERGCVEGRSTKQLDPSRCEYMAMAMAGASDGIWATSAAPHR